MIYFGYSVEFIIVIVQDLFLL